MPHPGGKGRSKQDQTFCHSPPAPGQQPQSQKWYWELQARSQETPAQAQRPSDRDWRVRKKNRLLHQSLQCLRQAAPASERVQRQR